MKLSYFSQTNESIVADAYDTLDAALVVANRTQRPVRVYNWQPGQHKHGSLYLVVTPDPVDTPLAEAYGG